MSKLSPSGGLDWAIMSRLAQYFSPTIGSATIGGMPISDLGDMKSYEPSTPVQRRPQRLPPPLVKPPTKPTPKRKKRRRPRSPVRIPKRPRRPQKEPKEKVTGGFFKETPAGDWYVAKRRYNNYGGASFM